MSFNAYANEMRTLGVLTDRTTHAQVSRCQSVDEWRLCWDYNKDAKAIIQSLTNVVPSHEQMGPGVWVGKQEGYSSPSWLDESRINGMQRHSRGSQHCMFLSNQRITMKTLLQDVVMFYSDYIFKCLCKTVGLCLEFKNSSALPSQ